MEPSIGSLRGAFERLATGCAAMATKRRRRGWTGAALAAECAASPP